MPHFLQVVPLELPLLLFALGFAARATWFAGRGWLALGCGVGLLGLFLALNTALGQVSQIGLEQSVALPLLPLVGGHVLAWAAVTALARTEGARAVDLPPLSPELLAPGLAAALLIVAAWNLPGGYLVGDVMAHPTGATSPEPLTVAVMVTLFGLPVFLVGELVGLGFVQVLRSAVRRRRDGEGVIRGILIASVLGALPAFCLLVGLTWLRAFEWWDPTGTAPLQKPQGLIGAVPLEVSAGLTLGAFVLVATGFVVGRVVAPPESAADDDEVVPAAETGEAAEAVNERAEPARESIWTRRAGLALALLLAPGWGLACVLAGQRQLTMAEQRSALVERHGALGTYAHPDPDGKVRLLRLPQSPASDEELARLLEELPDLTAVDLSGTQVSPATLAALCSRAQLQSLVLDNCPQIDDAALAGLAGQEQLSYLSLNRTSIGDDGCRVLGRLPALTQLYLGATKVGDEGLEHLAGLEKLVYLGLNGTRVSDAGTAAIEAKLPGLRAYAGR